MNSLVTPDWSTARGYWYWRKHAACVFGSRASPGISVALTPRPIDPDEGNIAAQILVERHVPRMADRARKDAEKAPIAPTVTRARARPQVSA
jgi:hypothetical protein